MIKRKFSMIQQIGIWLFTKVHGQIIFSAINCYKGELQSRNKLISSEKPFKILQNETKIVKIRQAVLEIFNFKYQDLDTFPRKNDRKTENVVFCRGFA